LIVSQIYNYLDEKNDYGQGKQNMSPLKDIFKCSEIKNHIPRKEPDINFEERKKSEILDSDKFNEGEEEMKENKKIDSKIEETWIIFKTIEFKELSFCREENKITLGTNRKNKTDETKYMKCQIQGCPIQYKVRIPLKPQPEDKITILMRSHHNHSLEELKNLTHYGVRDNIKQLIKPMMNNHVKPSKIKKVLEEYCEEGLLKKEEMPSLHQISDLRRNDKKLDYSLNTLGDFTKLVEEFQLEKETEDNESIIIGKNLQPDQFCLVFSSKSLLKNIIHQATTCSKKYLCLDGTYKLTALGYPLLVIGTQDLYHKFRLVALALSKHEREIDYNFVLSSVKHSLKTIFQYEWSVDLLLSDASQSIYRASRAIFGQNYIHGMCSVHLWRNLNKHIPSFVPTEKRKELKADLDFLQNLDNVGIFDVAISLFEEKWEDLSGFLDYFFENWINSSFSNWFRGSIPPGYSTTNNGIEGFNHGIKAKYTEWERLKIEDFVKTLKDIVIDHSTATAYSMFPISFKLTEELWNKAQLLQNCAFIQKDQATFYWGQSKNGRKVTQRSVTIYCNAKNSKNFESMVKAYCLWRVNIGINIMDSNCTCPQFRLYHYCKHILASLLKIEKIKVPDEYSQVKIIEKNTRRGRNKKASSALEIDDAK